MEMNMSRRKTLIVSVIVTAFVLMIVGGLIGNMSQTSTSAEPATVNAAQTALPQENVPDMPGAPDVTSASTGQITEEQAIQAAAAYLGGGTVAEVELEQERGILAYEVIFTDGNEVYVDAQTGEVLAASNARGNYADDDESDERYEHEADERESHGDGSSVERER